MPLVIFEGIDGSGKSTQAGLMASYFKAKSINARRLQFPNYGSVGCALVEMYLAGEFGIRPEDVNPYAASSFYAMDRYTSFKKDWEADYYSGIFIFADRYVTSNMVHQAAKLPENDRAAFIEWLREYEYGLLGLPRPDAVIFYSMPAGLCAEHVKKRSEKKDIHERDSEFLLKSARCAEEAALLDGWIKIDCSSEGKAFSPEIIHKMTVSALSDRGII